jgi:hypothetical protein
MVAGKKAIPLSRDPEPKVNLGMPLMESIPTVAKNIPMAPVMNPRTTDVPVSPVTQVIPKTPKAKYSAGPNLRATSVRKGVANMRLSGTKKDLHN